MAELLFSKHVQYIQSLDSVRVLLLFKLFLHNASCVSEQKKDELAYHLTEHLRMNGVYWGLTALALMGQTGALLREEMIDWVMSCWDEEAGAYLF